MANVLGELFGDIASAIREKTGDAEKMKPAQFPEKISEIETGADVSGVTATAEDVLNGKKFVDAGGNVIDGTMPNLGSKIIWWRNRPIRNPEAINQGGTAILEIEEGYHDGTSGIQLTFEYPKRYTPTKERKRFSSSYSTGMFLGDIDIDPIPDQYQDVTPVTATAEDVRAGKVFVDAEGNAVEGALSGTIADVSGVTATAADVRAGKIIVDAQGNEVVGTLVVEQKAPDVIWVGKDSVSNALVGTGVIRYVTFCNHDGTVTYGQKSVIAGENCVDPVTAGHMETPTRESTAQYNYTFSGGWATEPGGGINADALKNVTEDRTVYANFIAAVRYYNARFYSDGELVATVPTAYGTQAVSPELVKEGYMLDGWNPANLTIYGDTDFNAVWVERSGYVYVNTIPEVYATDVAINRDGTHLVVGTGMTLNAPVVYDISGSTPELISHSNTITGMTKCDYNYNETIVRGQSSKENSSYKQVVFTYSTPVTNGSYGTLIRSSQGTDWYSGSFMRCSPVEDVDAYGRQGNDYAGMKLNGITVNLGGIIASYAEFSPDGKLLAVSTYNESEPSAADYKRYVEIYNVADASLLRRITLDGQAFDVSFNADGSMVAFSCKTAPYFRVYNVDSGELVCTFENVFSSYGSCYFVFGTNELIMGSGTTVKAFDLTVPGEPQEIKSIPTYRGETIGRIRSNRSGTRVAITSTLAYGIDIWERA